LTNHHAEQSTGGVVFNTKHVVMLIIICKKPATKESSTKNKMNDNKYVARNYRKDICCKQKMEKVAKQKSIKLQLENP